MACFTKGDIGQCGCSCALQVTVLGCNDLPVGAGVTVNLKVGGSTIYSEDTDSSGEAAISGAAGTYDIEVVDGRTPSRWQTETFTGQILSCGGNTDVTLSSPQSGYHCITICGDPLADTLYATDANGTYTLTYQTPGPSGVDGWYSGCASKASMASVVTALAAGICTPTVGTGNVVYYIRITTDGAVANVYGAYQNPPQRTAATPTCSGGTINYNAGIPISCIGSVGPFTAGSSVTVTCPPSPSISGTMNSAGASSTANPGAGSITITE